VGFTKAKVNTAQDPTGDVNHNGNLSGLGHTANGAPERGAVATDTSSPVTKRAPSLPW
jgi:hypothetical protein